MIKPVSIIFSVLILFGCKKDENLSPVNAEQWNITSVDGSNVGTLNQSVSLTVYYPTASGCDVLDTFIQTQQSNIFIIKAFGHSDDSPFCTQEATVKTKIFNFVPVSKGTLELRFVN